MDRVMRTTASKAVACALVGCTAAAGMLVAFGFRKDVLLSPQVLVAGLALTATCCAVAWFGGKLATRYVVKGVNPWLLASGVVLAAVVLPLLVGGASLATSYAVVGGGKPAMTLVASVVLAPFVVMYGAPVEILLALVFGFVLRRAGRLHSRTAPVT